MIAWRTSRFLLLFFLLMLAIVGVAGTTIINQMQPQFWQQPLVALRALMQDEELPAIPTPELGPGQAVELPRYPVVQVMKPAASIFDPAS